MQLLKIDVQMIDWHLYSEVGSEETAAVFEAILQVDQVPALLQLVSHHQNLVPRPAFFAPQDLVVDQESKELVLNGVPLPQSMEDFFDSKQKHSCRDQKVGEVEDKPVNLNETISSKKLSKRRSHLVHETVFVDPPRLVPGTALIWTKIVSSTVSL